MPIPRTRTFWFALLLVTLLTTQGNAQEPESLLDFKDDDVLSLPALIHFALEHNPALHAARARARAAQHTPAQASAYDDPTVMWENWNSPESLRIDRADNNIFRLSQKIPFPGKLRLKGEIAAKDVERMKADARSVEIATIRDVKKAYYEIWLGYRTLQVYGTEKELVAQLAHSAEQKYAVGQVSQTDVLKAQGEVTRRVNRVTSARLGLRKAQAQLNMLLSRSPDAPLGIPPDPPFPAITYTAAELETLALTHRPELSAQATVVEKETLALALARTAYYPDFEVSVSRFVNFAQRDGFGFMVSATIPLAFKSKYDAGVEEATANQQTAHSELRHLHNVARLEVTQALLEAQVALDQHTLFSSAHIPQAEQTVAAAQIGYQTGTVDFRSLIDSVRTVEEVHWEHLMATANFEKAWADLERAVGKELARQ